MSANNLMEAWIADLHRVLEATPVSVSDVRIGVFYTAAQLGNGYAGVAFTPRGMTDTVCCPKSASVAPPAGRLAGRDAWDLAEYALSPVALRRAVGVAVLNALSSMARAEHGVPGGRLVPGMDALEGAGVHADDQVAMVGGFIPFIKALKGRVQDLWVVDKHPEALKEDELPFWRPPERAAEIRGEYQRQPGSATTHPERGRSCTAGCPAHAGKNSSPPPDPRLLFPVSLVRFHSIRRCMSSAVNSKTQNGEGSTS